MSEKIHIKTENLLNIYFTFCIDYEPVIRTEDEFLENLVREIPKTSLNYMGFKTKKALKEVLGWQIFGKQGISGPLLPPALDRREITRTIEKAIERCHEVLSIESIRIFVFPTFSSFVKKRMSGVAAFSIKKNVIYLFINPEIRERRVALRKAICHEFNHLVYNSYHQRKTLLDDLIFEGLAENFREWVINGKHAPWVKTLSLKDCQKIFLEVKQFLNSWNQETYYKLFFDFEEKEYPLWSGYAIGYHIVRKFLINNKDLSWEEIVRLKPKQILERSEFLPLTKT